jgi:hypothetical protein
MVMQCFRSSRGYGNFFSIGKKPKGQLTGTERPVAQALCLNGGKEAKTIRADLNHQRL